MKQIIFIILGIALYSQINAVADEGFAKTRYSCQYKMNEKVQLDINLFYGHNTMYVKSQSMKKPELVDILDIWETPRFIELSGYMPQPWPHETMFRIRLEANSSFHEIVLTNTQKNINRATLTCHNF